MTSLEHTTQLVDEVEGERKRGDPQEERGTPQKEKLLYQRTVR